MRVVRLAAFFLLGCALGAFAVAASAQTGAIPATVETVPKQGWAYSNGGSNYKLTQAEACAAIVNSQCQGNPVTLQGSSCKCFMPAFGYQNIAGSAWQVNYCPTGYTQNGTVCEKKTCPAGYVGPQTIGGVPDMCAPPQCEAGKVWDAQLNACADVCEGNQTRPPGSATCVCDVNALNGSAGARPWLYGDEKTTPESVCSGGCKRRLGFSLNSGTGWAAEGGAFTGDKCAAGEASKEEKPPLDKKKPPCAAGEGVMTSSSGTVACVPEGTPGAKPPKVEKKTKTETYPDDSQKKTEETKTTDTQTGVTSTSTTVTVIAGAGGGTEAGTPGTTSGATSDEAEQCEGEDCDQGEPADFGEYGEFYEKKYPDGLGGVLSDKFNAMKNSPLGQLAGQLVPNNMPSSGTCPSFSFGSNIGPAMPFGAGGFQPPCYVWDFIRVCMLISSLLLARRLIFGG